MYCYIVPTYDDDYEIDFKCFRSIIYYRLVMVIGNILLHLPTSSEKDVSQC